MLLRRPVWSLENSSTQLARLIRGFESEPQRLSLRLFLRHSKGLLLRTRRQYNLAAVQGKYANHLQSRPNDKVLEFKRRIVERARIDLI